MNIAGKLRQYMPLWMKDYILHSLPYRLYIRRLMPRMPVCISCEVTTRCNIACDMCMRKSLIDCGALHAVNMDDSIADRLVESIRKFHANGRAVYCSPMGMGEPLIYPKLIPFFARLKEISPSIGISLATNGILLTKEISRELISVGVDKVVVSLNAGNRDSYIKHMGIDRYEQVMSNTIELMQMKKSMGKITPQVYVQYIDYDNQADSYSSGIREWRKHMGPNDACYVHPVVNQAGFCTQSTFSDRYYSEPFPCTQPLWRIAVKANGNIYPCDPAFYVADSNLKSLYLGNISENNLYDLFNNPASRAHAIVDQMRKGDYSALPLCEKCNTYKLGPNPHFQLPFGRKLTGYKWY
jgi:radical SAM protein with 4Fe4S-binding SPASM domain